ncbi:hypothetical protein QYE76_009246 [Lolium multiflorum]|uniref:Pentatricopeptide repeat-containing protein n=1 Tax=Lolium multiflorum TaxID=4521 RepID=A0AAD8TUN6_LOLMU|nr:hypothetical protein QYE76_009246 [Lolium multiflorum]
MPPAPPYAVLAASPRTKNCISSTLRVQIFFLFQPAPLVANLDIVRAQFRGGWAFMLRAHQLYDRMRSRCFLRQPRLHASKFHPSLCVLISLRLCHTTASEDSRDVRVGKVLGVLRSCDADADLGKDLRRFAGEMDEDVVLKVLQKHRSSWQVALSFFNWAAGLPTALLVCRDEQDVCCPVEPVCGAHKVQEAIEMFYKRKEYGFEVDLVGFQILLISLCRYKHVEEAEALFSAEAR